MTLSKKLVRDLWESRSQYLAVGMVIALGVAFFGAAYMSYRNLDESYAASYRALRFEDFSIAFHEAPARVADRLRTIPGVDAVEGRLVQDVAVELGGEKSKKLVGRLIAIPVGRRPTVDDLQVTEGRYPSDRTAREVLIEYSFASQHNLHPGSTLDVLDRGTRTRLKIAGVVKSAEYIYVVRSKQDIMPSAKTFGVMFMGDDVLGEVLAKSGQISEVKVRVSSLASRSPAMREAKRLLSAYRPEEPVPREEQPSYQLLQQDIEGFQLYAVFFPFLFLSVAGLTIYSLLTRLVHSQRSIIGLLRALGFTKGQVVRHYLNSAFTIGVIASLGGTALGLWLASVFTDWYLSFVSAPISVNVLQWDAMAFGLAIGCLVCLIAGYRPALWASSVEPAASMRPEPPGVGRVIRLDALIPGLRLINRIPLRSLFRQPRRTLSTLAGVIVSLTLIVTAGGLQDSIDAVMSTLTSSLFREDLRVDFVTYEDRSVVEKVRSWQGVSWAEGELDLPMTFHKGALSYDALAIGVPENSRLRSLVTADGEPVRPTEQGAIFGPTLRKRLKLERGDLVVMELPRAFVQGEEPRRIPVRVLGFNEEPIGTLAYLRQSDLRSAVKDDISIPGGGITSVRIMCDPVYAAELKGRLLDLELAGSASMTSELMAMWSEQLGLMRRFVIAMLIFGATLAFVVMFNMVTINVIERESEVATMRTLGIGRAEITWLVTQENLWLCLVGVIIGLPVGRWMCGALIEAAQTEEQQDIFSFGAVIGAQTFWFAVALVVAATIIAEVSPLIRLGRLNLSGVMKRAAR